MRYGDREGVVILRGEVGSTAHGTGLPGKEDRDEMAVMVEDKRDITGLGRFDQIISRSRPAGVRSEPGDLDLTIYGLQKYMRLAVQGNPSILVLLFAEEGLLVKQTQLGIELRGMTDSIVSKLAIPRFRGYMCSQALRLMGLKGGHGVLGGNRPELVSEYGWDTKFGGHMIRLGLQCVELMETGRFSVPMLEGHREMCLDIRKGKYPVDDVLELAFDLDVEIAEGEKTTQLPDKPMYRVIHSWMHEAYLYAWAGNS